MCYRHDMSVFDDARRRVIDRALTGSGVSSSASRRAAFDNQETDPRVSHLVQAVAAGAWAVTDEDVARPLQAGVAEDEIFELVVCAALGQAQRQLDAAMRVVDRVTGAKAGDRPGAQP
jgi:hypothetical protein